MSWTTTTEAASTGRIESMHNWEQGSEVAAEIMPPPGLLPPPGLAPPVKVTRRAELDADAALFQSSGLFEDVYHAAGLVEEPASYVEVTINGVPDKLLSQMMVEVMLEQIALDSPIVSYAIRRGLAYGCIDVRLASSSDARKCVQHFNGRTWDSAGMPVRAEIVSTSSVSTLLSTIPTPQRPSSRHTPCKSGQPMSANARAFKPKTHLCVETPAFVPVSDLKSKAHLVQLRASKSGASETSTDWGESESDSDSRSSVKL